MGKRGVRAKGKIEIRWSDEFAYAIGLLTTDGNLSSDGRHLSLASNDIEQIENFKKCLGITNKIGRHISGTSKKLGFRIQFGDVLFYKFLKSIGLTANKSKTLGKIKIPDKYFFDFLRGHFDGDGCFYSYWDPRWKSSFMFYTTFLSASKSHIDWLRQEIYKKLKIKGHMTRAKSDSIFCLKYAKAESMRLLPKIYAKDSIFLKRKYLKIKRALDILGLSI